VSGYFDKLAARAFGEPARLAPPPRLRFGEPAGLDPVGPVPGESTVVTEVAAERPVAVEPRPARPPMIDSAPGSRLTHAPAPPSASAAVTPDPGPTQITERTRTVEREIVVREPGADAERRPAEPSARSAATGDERPRSAPVPAVSSEPPAPVIASASDRAKTPDESARAIVTEDRRSRGDQDELARGRRLGPLPRTPEPVTVAPVVTAIDANRDASTGPPVTIAIGRIELRAPDAAAPPPPRAPERPRRSPRKPALPLDEYLEQRSRG
jgi:hypothetical protein